MRGGAEDPDRRPKRTVLPPGGVEARMLKTGHVPTIEVMVNGQGPFRFMVDTGAAGTARIDSALAARLGLEKVGEAMGGDPSGRNRFTMTLVEVDSIGIGGARFAGVTAAVRNFSERGLGEPVDGVLGFGLFADALLTLDYPRERVEIAGGEIPAGDGGEVIGFEYDRGVPRISIRVAGIEVDADIDAGAPGGFSLPEALAARLPLVSEPRVVGRGRTVSNSFEVKAADLKGNVMLGPYTFTNPRLEFQPLFPMADIGARVLRDLRVTFDQKNRRMRLVKADVAARSPLTGSRRKTAGGSPIHR
jgi:hypothetical protein